MFDWFCLFFRNFAAGEYVNIACSVILLLSEGNISSPVRYSYLSILSNGNAESFATSLLMLYYVNIIYINIMLILSISFDYSIKALESL